MKTKMTNDDIKMAVHNEHRYRRRNFLIDSPNMSIANIVKAAVVLILVINTKVLASEVSEKDELAKRMRIIESVSGRFFNDVYTNGTFRTGNHLWDNILNQCSVKPSMSCLQKNVYSYLNDKLDFDGDVKVTSGMCFKKNNVDINQYTKEANIIYLTGSKDEDSARYLDEDNEVGDEDEPESPIEEVTDALYDKGVKFLTTHDMKLTLPDFFFDGATLKISPRALTKTGALVHIDLEPRETEGQGRLFFHKIKKYIRKKLVTAAIAIILVVKLIALKLIFVLPLILGITTAKKMFLKLLLFLFPALSHIFKLCSWYHQNYHTTKYHHHHHLITHHHKAPHHGGPYSGHSAHGSLVVRPGASAPAPTFEHYPQDWELSGPGLGSEYLASDIHRNAIATFKPHVNDANDINAWGLGLPPGPSMNLGEVGAPSNTAPALNGQKLPPGGAGRPVGPPNPYYRNKKIQQGPKDPIQAEKEALIRAASIASRAPPSPVRDEILRVSAVKLKETNRIKTETDLVKQQQQILAAQDPETIAAEQFYGAIIEKVDSILAPIGATEQGCKERAICSMYGDPFKHAPYSNLVSNELSKDSSELIPAADSKMALRFYRYVQAARDGQEQKDCLSSYPQCEVNYNRK